MNDIHPVFKKFPVCPRCSSKLVEGPPAYDLVHDQYNCKCGVGILYWWPNSDWKIMEQVDVYLYINGHRLCWDQDDDNPICFIDTPTGWRSLGNLPYTITIDRLEKLLVLL